MLCTGHFLVKALTLSSFNLSTTRTTGYYSPYTIRIVNERSTATTARITQYSASTFSSFPTFDWGPTYQWIELQSMLDSIFKGTHFICYSVWVVSFFFQEREDLQKQLQSLKEIDLCCHIYSLDTGQQVTVYWLSSLLNCSNGSSSNSDEMTATSTTTATLPNNNPQSSPSNTLSDKNIPLNQVKTDTSHAKVLSRAFLVCFCVFHKWSESECLSSDKSLGSTESRFVTTS